MSAWTGHTEESRAQAQNFERALEQHGVKHEFAAAVMQLENAAALSKQLAGAKPLNLWRLGYLKRHPDTAPVYLTWLALEARREGAELLTAEDRAFVIGFATAGVRRMAKMLPSWFTQDERRRA